jgi:hypothetical protein
MLPPLGFFGLKEYDHPGAAGKPGSPELKLTSMNLQT